MNNTDDYVYHITPIESWQKIKELGIVGAGKEATEEQMRAGSKEGYIYVLDSNNREAWQTIPRYIYNGKIDWYCVGISKDYLTNEGFKIEEDSYKYRVNQPYGENHKQIYIGDSVIPMSACKPMGVVKRMNAGKWEEMCFRIAAELKGIPIEDVILMVILFGDAEYDENGLVYFPKLYHPLSIMTAHTMNHDIRMNSCVFGSEINVGGRKLYWTEEEYWTRQTLEEVGYDGLFGLVETLAYEESLAVQEWNARIRKSA